MEIVDYDESLHLSPLVTIAHRMRLSERAYPPKEFCGESREDVHTWLSDCHAEQRWVAFHDGSVLGHIALTEPEDYLNAFLESYAISHEYMEISKFFVNSDYRKSGVGSLLFSQALEYATKPKALAVLQGSYAARDFYVNHGMIELGQFDGISGVNHVFIESKKY